MKQLKKNLFLVVLSFLSFQLLAHAASSEPILVKGRVTDAVTKKPVSGVVVSIVSKGNCNSKEAVTDSDGFFSFTELGCSEINLVFDKKGYKVYESNALSVKEKTTVKLKVEVHPDNSEIFPDDSEYPILRILGMK